MSKKLEIKPLPRFKGHERIIWVNHPTRGLMFDVDKKGDGSYAHYDWFPKIGLPDSGEGFDKPTRGWAMVDTEDHKIWVKAHPGNDKINRFKEVTRFAPKGFTEKLHKLIPWAKGYTIADEYGGKFIESSEGVNWTSPQSPSGQDWFEVSYGLNSMPPYHPPSLKNPIKVKIPMAQDGWKRGDSKKSREQAMKDLVEIHRRLRYSKGKPTIARVADYPIIPPIGSY